MKKQVHKTILSAMLFLAFVLLCSNVFAQAPQKMSYQSVIRDADGILVTSHAVGIQISVMKDSANGTAVFVETHTTTTNANGLVSLEIGGGIPVTGTFSTIDWAHGSYFIKTETDPTGDTNYTIASTSQLMSVPYAFYATNGGTPGSKGDKGDTGVKGDKGDKGDKGNDGATGKGIVIKGSAPTVSSLPTGAVAGDLYVVLADSNAYLSDGLGGWANVGKIQGPAGARGATGPQGLQGLQGPIGLTGLTGAIGPQGPQGQQGIKGDKGNKGVDGTSVVLKGSVPTVSLLPVGAVAGDLYIVLADSNAYVSDGLGGWTNLGKIQGPTGEKGAMGSQGLQGIQGEKGNIGATGTQGPIGLTGSPGSQGIQGEKGTQEQSVHKVFKG